MSRTNLLLVSALVIAPGIVGIAVFGWKAIEDWCSLQVAYAHYQTMINEPSSLTSIAIANSQQNIQRINLFADGVWTLLSAILFAIGTCSVVVLKRR